MAKAEKPNTPSAPEASENTKSLTHEEWLAGRNAWLSGSAPLAPVTAAPALARPSTAVEPTTAEWILLSAAWALVVQAFQSAALSERKIVEWLAAGQVRWRCLLLEPHHKQYADLNGDPEFWREANPRQSVLIVNWAESWARAHGMGGCTAHRVELARLDILELLPKLPDQPQAPQDGTNKTVLAAESDKPTPRPRKARLAPAVECAMAALRGLFPPDGKASVGTLVESGATKLTREVHKWYKEPEHKQLLKHNWKLPDRRSVGRAVAKLGHE